MPYAGHLPHDEASARARWLRPLALAAAAVALVLPRAAAAQGKGAPAPGKYQPITDFRLSRASEAERLAAAGRAKAAAGDCKAALDYFDQALRTSMEPLIFRDRGKCHDKEGNLRPAIDDYRAYLSARPDAPDADAVNERLLALDAQYGVEKGDKENGSRDPFASTAAGAKVVDAEAKKEDKKRNYDAEVAGAQKMDEAYLSPLRRGRGGAVGFQAGYRTLVGGGVQHQGGYLVGLSGRYAFNERITGLAEIGYGAYGQSGAIGHYAVLLGFLGAEARAPLDAYATHQLFAAGGLGFETSTGKSTIDITYWAVPRVRAGYRYLLASTVGLEAAFDTGLYYFRSTATSVTSTSGPGGTTTAVTKTTEGHLFGSVGVLGGLVVGF